MKFYAEKIIELKDADIHLHYANNKGRGSNNLTVTFVKSGTLRPQYTREYDQSDAGPVINQYRKSAWNGVFYIPSKEMDEYGGLNK